MRCFDVSRPWLLLILHGRLAFDGNGRDQTRLLDPDDQCLCLQLRRIKSSRSWATCQLDSHRSQ